MANDMDNVISRTIWILILLFSGMSTQSVIISQSNSDYWQQLVNQTPLTRAEKAILPHNPRPDDGGCYQVYRFKEIVPKEQSKGGNIYRSTHSRPSYVVNATWVEYVCPDKVTDDLYEVLLAALSSEGYSPKADYQYNSYKSAYSHHLNAKAIECLRRYQVDHNLPYQHISTTTLDNLNIDIDNLDAMKAQYNIMEPTLKELLRYSVKFDLEPIDEDGLIGPVDGKRSVAYNYMIENIPARLQQIKSIDPTMKVVEIPSHLNETIGCENCIMITGETHQDNYLEVLYQLVELEYIHQIHERIYKY